MPSGQDILRSATIILFASGIVAIGADQLYRKHRVLDGSRNMQSKELRMLEDFSGSDVKARMAPERAQRTVNQRTADPRTADQRTADQRNVVQRNVVQRRVEVPEKQQAEKERPAVTKDSLSRGDRSELDGLLDSLIK